MKKSDIKVGQEYAVARSDYEFDRGSATRARVISTDGKVTQGWGYNQRTITGTVIQYLNPDGTDAMVRPRNSEEPQPHQRTVPNREIREEWETYNERWTEIRRQRAERKSAEYRAQVERAKRVPALIEALREAGFEDRTERLYTNAISTRLLAEYAGEYVSEPEGEGVLVHRTLTAPFAKHIEGYVINDGRFPLSADDLLRMLAR